MDAAVLYPLTGIYVLMGITGTLGNSMVCIVIFRNISMRTSTNLFLFTLACADIATLLMGMFCDILFLLCFFGFLMAIGLQTVRIQL